MSINLPPNHGQPPPGFHENADAEAIRRAQEHQLEQKRQAEEQARRQRELDAEMRRRAEETSQRY